MSEENAALGKHMIELLGPVAARQLLDVLTRSEEHRAALIGRLSQRDDATALAEMLIEIETDPDDITRGPKALQGRSEVTQRTLFQ
jgi:hypothetical protein